MSWPHFLFHLWNFAMSFEDDNIKWVNTVGVLQKGYIEELQISLFLKYLNFAFSCNFPKVSIVVKGDMIRGMPVEADWRMSLKTRYL